MTVPAGLKDYYFRVNVSPASREAISDPWAEITKISFPKWHQREVINLVAHETKYNYSNRGTVEPLGT